MLAFVMQYHAVAIISQIFTSRTLRQQVSLVVISRNFVFCNNSSRKLNHVPHGQTRIALMTRFNILSELNEDLSRRLVSVFDLCCLDFDFIYPIFLSLSLCSFDKMFLHSSHKCQVKQRKQLA